MAYGDVIYVYVILRAMILKIIHKDTPKTLLIYQNEILKKCSSNPQGGRKRETEKWKTEEINKKQNKMIIQITPKAGL